MSSLASQSQSDKIRQAVKELICISKGEGSPIQLVRTVESLECSPADESSAEEVDKTDPGTTPKPTAAPATVPFALEDEPVSKATLINDSASLHLSAKETAQSHEPVAPSATVSTRGQSSGSPFLPINLTLSSAAIVFCLLRQ